MVVANPDNSKNALSIFIVVMALFLIGAIVTFSDQNFTADHSVSGDALSLLESFRSLTSGDIHGFIDGLVSGIPIIAMFFVLFSILHFLMTTVMKPVFPNRKTATIIALIIAIYGFVDQRIYNLMLSLNAYLVGFLVFSAFVIMLWSFGRSTTKSAKKEFDELSKYSKLSKAEREKIKEFLKGN
ncbi:MAG: hypothetical protein ACLFTH_04545 [Candidatus Woesearchaeota archaeon]